MTDLPGDLKYTQNHEWLKVVDEGAALIGITYFAQESLGDITYIEMPKVGAQFKKGDSFGVIESVKAASDLYMPVAGDVLEVNPELDDAPEAVNASPYTEGWLMKIKLTDPEEVNQLMSPEEYKNCIAN